MIFFLAYFTLYNRLQFRPSHQNWFKWILFYGWVVLHCVYVPQLSYPFICWWTSRLLPCPGCYKLLWWTLGYMCLFQFWFPQCVCPAMGLLGHKVVLFAIFSGISTLFSIVAVLVCIPTNSVWGFPFLHTLSSIYCLQIFGSQPFWLVEVVPHCGFDLHFSNNEWCWASFHVFVSHPYVFFGEMSI